MKEEWMVLEDKNHTMVDIAIVDRLLNSFFLRNGSLIYV